MDLRERRQNGPPFPVGRWRRWTPARLLMPLLAWAATVSVLLAQSGESLPPPDALWIYERLERQEAELNWLRARFLEYEAGALHANATQVPPPPAAANEGAVSTATFAAVGSSVDEPGRVDPSSEKWTVRLGGHVQLDYVTWANTDPAIVDPEADNYFNYRRLRLVADGTGYGQFDFRLQMTLEPGQGANDNRFASPDVKDAYLSMNDIPGLGRMRIGNFFVPFSLEQVTNDTNNIFVERSIPTQNIFAADREVGIAFYNCTADRNITWSTGFFFDDLNDTFKTRIDDNQGYRLAGRLTWLPYYDEPSNGRYLVHTGIGVLHTDDFDDLVRFRARPQVQRGPVLIDSGNQDAGSYTTGNMELAVVWGQVTVQNEAFLSSVNLAGSETGTVGGAYSHISCFLTGENRIFERFGQHGPQFARNQPFTNFFWAPGCVGSGAWEVKARWSYLDLSAFDEGQYNDITAGFNWYWSDRTRWMFDWIHPMTTSETVFGTTDSDLIAMRFDFNW